MIKVENKKRFTVFVIAAFLLLAGLFFGIREGIKLYRNKYQKTSQTDGQAEVKVVERGQAAEIAKKFLKKQPFAKDYKPEPARVENFEKFWSVWFEKTDKNSRPNKGLIQVDKHTEEAIWKELQ